MNTAAQPREWSRFRVTGNTPVKGKLILIHGLFMSGWIWIPAARFFAGQGYESILYDYPTCSDTIAGHGASLAAFIADVYNEAPDVPIFLTTHSLGGIIARAAIHELPPEIQSAVQRIVQIAPPNLGSDMAKLACDLLPFAARISRVLPELSSAKNSTIHHVPDFGLLEYGVIGASRDIEVRRPYYFLPDTKHFVLISAGHTSVLFLRKTWNQVLRFLKHGSFAAKP